MMEQADMMDALIGKLERDVSPIWGSTFAGTPGIDVDGYKRLQKLVNTYDEETVRSMFEYAHDVKIVPKVRNAYPLAMTLCRAIRRNRDDD